ELLTPRDPSKRGTQVSLRHMEGYAIMQALIARGVIGDFRAGDGARHPDILRFGFTPLYLGYEDAWRAVEQLREVLQSGEWREEKYSVKSTVT
ncbi:MAG: kynureninase, partial [Candidatus Parcubacteria bacterium]|nr:kynureninase [Burkholderiales bacterium]